MDLSIIIPTYNEKESIGSTLHNILKAIPKRTSYEILVIDDNSPDGTAQLIITDFAHNKHIKCIVRKKDRGLSQAVIEGCNHAQGKYFLVMDADGQHDEKIIPDMLRSMQTNQLTIGSRFVTGGVGSWPTYRLMVSKAAAWLAGFLLKKKIQDPMSGYFCIDKRTFMKIRHRLQAKGYKLLLDVLFELQNAHISFAIAEIPYTFKERHHGKSKLGLHIIYEYLIMLIHQACKSQKTI